MQVRAVQGPDSDPATALSDFSNANIVVEFGADEDVAEARIPIYDDNFEEGLESFVVEIIDLSTGTDAVVDNEARETVVCIRDDDGES